MAFIVSLQNVMNATEFRINRDQQLKEFDQKYASLKSQYATALQDAMTEQDRPKQCVKIKEALDANQKLTTLVGSYLTANEKEINSDMVRNLRADIEKYKEQHIQIQHGKDKLFALEQAKLQLQEKIDVTYGVQLIYITLIVIGLILLLVLIFSSNFSSVGDTQSVSSVLPGSLA